MTPESLNWDRNMYTGSYTNTVSIFSLSNIIYYYFSYVECVGIGIGAKH